MNLIKQQMLAVTALLAVSLSAQAIPYYTVDDGTGETNFGLDDGGTVTWLNEFTVFDGNNLIESVEVAFGVDTRAVIAAVAAPLTIYIWDDVNNDGAPDDAVVITSFGSSVILTDSDLFTVFDIPDTLVSGTFFVGVEMTTVAGIFPARLDLTSAVGQSWVSITGVQDAVNVDSFSPGNFMIRANASVPTPATIALMGLGLIGLGAVRRKTA